MIRIAKPTYKAYVERQRRLNKPILKEKQWRSKVLGEKDEAKRKREKRRKSRRRDEALQKSRESQLEKTLDKDLKESYGREKLTVKELDPEHREEIKEYKLDIVGEDAVQSVEIARKIRKGIEESADICKVSPPVCVGNKGIPRDKMPQIEGEKSVSQMLASKNELDRKKGEAMVQAGADPSDDRPILAQMVDELSKNGVKTVRTKIQVGRLKATQSEIKAAKTFGMADSHLKGKYDSIGDSVVVSRDGHILDGHHRWAALLTIDPSREMNVQVIDMDMDDLLAEAASFPGVYKADFKGDPLEEKEQKEYKRVSKSRFKKQANQLKAVFKVAMTYSKLASVIRKNANSFRDMSLEEVTETFYQGVFSEVEKVIVRFNIRFTTRELTTPKGGIRKIWKFSQKHWLEIEIVDKFGNTEISGRLPVDGDELLEFQQLYLAPSPATMGEEARKLLEFSNRRFDQPIVPVSARSGFPGSLRRLRT